MPDKTLSTGTRYTLAALLILILILLLAAALTIPFTFESPSMWYKFGLDKTSLRVGKLLGLAAGVLILVQLVLAARFKFLDRVFSMPALLRQHRLHAWGIAIMGLAHPVLVLYAEKKWMIPLETRYWPEWVGVGLLLLILPMLAASQWRQRLGIAFHRWAALHRIGGLLIAALLVVHVLYVSESFSDNVVPFMAVVVAAIGFGIAWLWVRSGWMRARLTPYEVATVESGGVDATSITLRPLSQKQMEYAPGQFAIVSFRASGISREPHPFTISSAPGQGSDLQFTIRACGDWTRAAGRLQPGDQALIQGPFGRFGHRFVAPHGELILIAGGIGITPMLSMLRDMASREDPRAITLIWSNRSHAHMVYPDEIEGLKAQLTGLRCIPTFTRNTDDNRRPQRLERARLQDLLSDCSRRAAVFVCGPPAMMKQLTRDLKALGFPARAIHTENFGY